MNLFGLVNESHLWVVDSEHSLREESLSLTLNPGQLICVILKQGRVEVSRSAQDPVTHENEGILVFRSTGKSRVQFCAGKNGKKPDFLVLGTQETGVSAAVASSAPESGGFRSGKYQKPAWETMLPEMRNPPVYGSTLDIWYLGKLAEILSLYLFDPAGSIAPLENRTDEIRVERTKQYIDSTLDQKFDLKAAADFAGCSPHYLSRKFSEHEGTTIIRYMRRMRIEKAAELLASKEYNVSEAATAVGYHSQSHFTKAFLEVKGVLPSHYTTSNQ